MLCSLLSNPALPPALEPQPWIYSRPQIFLRLEKYAPCLHFFASSFLMPFNSFQWRRQRKSPPKVSSLQVSPTPVPHAATWIPQNSIPLGEYKYHALQQEDEIRLLKVFVTSDSHHYSYQLVHTTIHDAPPFQAVSYVWGNASRENQLLLADQSFMLLNHNLHCALPQLSKFATGYLWIDQLSIDQSSLVERNHQVKIMGQIYKKSNDVLIWVNEELNMSKELNELFNRIDLWVADRNCPYAEFYPSAIQPLLRDTNMSQHYQRVMQIVGQAYFSRAWVVQEAVLPSRARFIIGNDVISLPALHWGCKILVDVRKLLTSLFTGVSWNNPILSSPGYTALLKMHSLWKEQQSSRDATPFYEILETFSPNCHVTDPRDIIYAFLGLQNNPRILIQPEYSNTVEQVMIHTAERIIHGSGDLDLFGHSRCASDMIFYDRSGIFRILPSWVPDWTGVSLYNRIHRHASQRKELTLQQSACGGRMHNSILTSTSNQLIVKGKIIAKVSVTLDAQKFDLNLSVDIWHYLRIDSSYMKTRFDAHFLSVKGTNIEDNLSYYRLHFLRAVVADCVWNYSFPEEARERLGLTAGDIVKMLAAYDDFPRENYDNLSSHDFSTPERAYMNELRYRSRVAHERYLFISSTGKVGLAGKAQYGDIVCILHGCSTPVILRSTGHGTFHVMEDCYLEGAMYGEALNWEESEADEFILV
jgi:hypothetical protein